MKKILLLLFIINCQVSIVFSQTTMPMLTLNTNMHTATINRISTNASGNLILTCSLDKTAKLWNAQNGSLIKTFRIPIEQGNEGMVNAGAISPDGKIVAFGGWTGYTWDKTCSIYIFDVATNTLKHKITGASDVICDIEFSGDGNYMVATLGGNNGIRIFKTTSWTLEKSFTNYGYSCLNAAFDNSGRLATVCFDRKIRLYDNTFKLLKEIETKVGKQPVSIVFSPDGVLLAVGYLDSYQIQVFDGKTVKLLYEPDVTSADMLKIKLVQVAFSNDGGCDC